MNHTAHTHHHAAPVPEPVERFAALSEALKELLIERGLLTAAEVRKAIEALESPGNHLGARLVAQAWTDSGFRARLLTDAKLAAAELGIAITEVKLVVLENTPRLHNLIVCTLCSCYPRSLLGQPPGWYTSTAYRARSIREPREVLKEFGTVIDPSVEIRVHDSIADMRYLVLPMRPAGTGHLDALELAALVSRDSLIGTAI